MATRTKLAAALHQAPNRTLGGPDTTRETLRASQTPPAVAAKPRSGKPQGIGTDQFMYFFLRLRKGEVVTVRLLGVVRADHDIRANRAQ